MSREKRKIDHIEHALSTGQELTHGFEDIQFIHHSLPATSLSEVSMETKIGELFLSSPIFINAMTGGGGTATYNINKSLAEVAKVTGLAISVGSQTSALRDSKQERTYQVVRETNPSGIVIGNVGSNVSVDDAKRAVQMIEANALQIHLNVVQELVMPEGDRDFKHVLMTIENICKEINVPIIVKEVGFGIDFEAAKKLNDVGVSIIDVGGFGGTNFARVENKRRSKSLSFFDDWGINTTSSIVEVCEAVRGNLPVIASGGIQNAIDIAKAIALGASGAAIAGHFLKILVEQGEEALVLQINEITTNLKLLMTALGAKTITELQQAPMIISGDTYHWLEQRGINTKKYSQRKRIR
jgi:isopentenyl-diphosphate delta-isomerase